MANINISQAILEGASLVDNLKSLRVKDEQRQIDRQYMREDAARKRQETQAQLDSTLINNRMNALNADSKEIEIEELKRQNNLNRRVQLRSIVQNTINSAVSPGQGLQRIANDKHLLQQLNEVYPGMGWADIRPVDLNTVNPELINKTIDDIALTNAIKRHGGMQQVKSIVDGKEATSWKKPDVTEEDLQYARNSLLAFTDANTGELKLIDGNTAASVMFNDLVAEAEWNKQQEEARQKLYDAHTKNTIDMAKAQAENTKAEAQMMEAKAKVAGAQLDQAKYATDLQNQHTALQTLQLADIKSVKVGNGSIEFQKVTSGSGGIEMTPGQAQQNTDIAQKMFSVIQQNVNPYTGQQFVDSKEMIDTIQKVGIEFMTALKAQNLPNEEIAKQYRQQVTPFLRQLLVNGNVEDPTDVTQFYYELTGKKPDNNTLGQIKALKSATRYLNDPNKLTEDKVGIIDTPIRNFMSMISDALPDGFQEEIYKDALARKADSDLITTVLTASLGSQITKNELKLYDISPSLFDSFTEYKAKLQTALNAMADRANAMVMSDDMVVSAEGELLLQHLQKYREGMAKIEAFSTATKDLSKLNPLNWGKDRNNLKEIVLGKDNKVANNQALIEARAKGNAILFKSNEKYYFIPASQPGDTSTTAQPILISEQEAKQLRQFKVKE